MTYSQRNRCTVKSGTRLIDQDIRMIPSRKKYWCVTCLIWLVCVPNSWSHYLYQCLRDLISYYWHLQSADVSHCTSYCRRLRLHPWVQHWHHVGPLPLWDGGARRSHCWQYSPHASQVGLTIFQWTWWLVDWALERCQIYTIFLSSNGWIIVLDLISQRFYFQADCEKCRKGFCTRYSRWWHYRRGEKTAHNVFLAYIKTSAKLGSVLLAVSPLY